MTKSVHAVGVLLENSNSEILVLLRHKNEAEGKTWSLVGGTINEKEDRKAALIREVKEEIGMMVKDTDLKFVKTFVWKRPKIIITFELFRMRFVNNHNVLKLQNSEATHYVWDKPENLYKRPDLMLGLYDILKTLYKV
jgi:ADP-ribose pyrophosphatase YjhB (NUDIX family)